MSFAVMVPPGDAGPVYPVRVGPTGRYLVDQTGAPFLIAGESPQAMIGNLTDADAELFFANRQAHGFNTVWINLLCASYTGCNADGTTFDGIAPFTTPGDLATPNPAYFARADRILQLAAQYGFLVILDPIETGGWISVLEANGVDKARAYGQYLGQRYAAFDNILWMHGNDFQSWQNPTDDALVQAVALGIHDFDSRHLHTVELNFWVSSSLDDPTWAPLIQLNAAYTYSPTYQQILLDFNRPNFLPTFMVEASYEFEQNSPDVAPGIPQVLRRQEYWSLLSGATGQLYGNFYTWPFRSGWQSQLDTPGAVQMAYVTALFGPRRWYDLVPDQGNTLVTAGLGTFGDIDYVTAARTPDGALAMAYMPTSRTVTVNMARLSGPITARWYDPTSGTFTDIPGSPLPNVGFLAFTPPGAHADGFGDWVLVLEVLDTTAPTIAITTPTTGLAFLTNASPLSLAGTAADNVAVTEITWVNSAGGAGTASGTTSWTVPTIHLQPGLNVILLTAHDAATNTATATLTVTYDATAPDTTITASPAALTNSTSASFSFTATEAGSTFECSLDGAAFSPCASPQSYIAPTAGSHTFQVRAIDPAGNTDATPATFTWTIDTTAPDTTITANLPAVTNSTSATLSFTATKAGSTFECKLDGGTFATCTNPQSYSALAAGSHTFQVRATDPAGNVDATPASFTWTIDTTAPDTTISTAPPALTNSTSASFSFSGTKAGSTFECKLDSAAFSVCTSPQSYSVLAAGSHTFQVRAIDSVGNVDPTPASFTWIIDTTAPDTTITANPPLLSNSATATFSFTATKAGSTFECRLDVSMFAACVSPKTYIALITGSHTYQVRATDPAGNIDPTPASYTWSVDYFAPTVAIKSPTSNATYSTSNTLLTLAGTAVDNVAVTQVTWSNDRGGSGTASGTTNWTASGIELQFGTNVITVTARDATANIASVDLTVTLSAPSTFTDDPLWAQSTIIKTVHILELRTAIDSVRVAHLLKPFTWTDAVLAGGITPVKAVHLTDLRTALNQAYPAGQAPTYTDASVGAGVTVIKAVHLSELRTAVRALQ